MLRQRRPNRQRGIDYSRPGFYFVTICTQNRESVFGECRGGEMILNGSGRIAQQHWLAVTRHYLHCHLRQFVIMPNHLHGIIEIVRKHGMRINVGTGFKPVPTWDVPTWERVMPGDRAKVADARSAPMSGIRPHSLSEIIRGFKTFSSRAINRMEPDGYFRWQRSFYDRVIRDRHELAAFDRYILDNPQKWLEDEENPFADRIA